MTIQVSYTSGNKQWRTVYHTLSSRSEYGRECELVRPWRGYCHGIVVALTDTGFIVRLTSGVEIEVYGDENKLC